MELYLVRHGEAVSEQADRERPLTVRGKAVVRDVAMLLKKNGLSVDRIWHSTKRRAIETAEIFSECLNGQTGCEKKEGLEPNDSVEILGNKLDEYALEFPESKLMIVGHAPFLPRLASLLLTGTNERELVFFPEAGVLSLRQSPYGRWQIQAFLNPELISKTDQRPS